MKKRDWLINTAATAVPLTVHPHCGGKLAIRNSFAGSCTLSEYFPSSY